MRLAIRKPSISVPKIIWCFAFLMTAQAPAMAADVALAWDANTEPDLAGYRVYRGTASGIYSPPIALGLQTTYTFTGLSPGTYYFAVTALNRTGLESVYSNEVSVTIQGLGCDINGDSSVNVSDIQTLVNVIMGARAATPNCDINRDGNIDVLDLQILVNVILGLRSCP